MNVWIKKIHIYLGLLNFTNLMVYGITGVVLALEAAPEQRRRPEPQVRYEAFLAPAGASDQDVATRAWEALAIPLSGPPPKPAVRRDRDNNVAFQVYTINGPSRVTVLEKENRVKVETSRNTLAQFINGLHESTYRGSRPAMASRLWAIYNEIAIATLLLLAVSGPYLWLTSRPRMKLARYSLAAGCAVFLALYILTR